LTLPDLTPAPTTPAEPTAPAEPVADQAARFTPPLRLGQSWRWPAGFAVAAIVLFLAYLRIALHHGFGSDGAVLEQQAWSMLNGNPLLRGWTVADISFYTIEIPELAVVEWLHGGVAPIVLSVAEAFNLTVFVLLVAFLAKGSATGREGLIRALVAGGIVFAPVLGGNTTLMLGNPDHLMTQVFVLAAWLIIDRSRPRWWVPVAVAAVLAWARMSDSIVLLQAELPLIAVCAVRIYRRGGGALRDHWYELSLGAAAIAAELVAQLVLVTVHAMGGFSAFPLDETFVPVAQLSNSIWVTVESTLLLYGADFSGLPLKGNVDLITVAVHLVGVALAVAGTIYAIRRFASSDLMPQIVTAMLVASVLAFTLLGTHTPGGGAHDVFPVLPAGAVLAGRMTFKAPFPRRLVAVVMAWVAVSALLLAHYTLTVGYAATKKPIAAWLVDHNLRFGLSNYYAGSWISVDANNKVTVAPVKRIGDRLELSPWESTTSWYNPANQDANFFLANHMQQCPADDLSLWANAAIRAYGPPAHTYWVDGVEVMVWNKNLLDTKLPQLPISRPSAC
jgi:hypothetical protein